MSLQIHIQLAGRVTNTLAILNSIQITDTPKEREKWRNPVSKPSRAVSNIPTLQIRPGFFGQLCRKKYTKMDLPDKSEGFPERMAADKLHMPFL